jgi:hypothetical protein
MVACWLALLSWMGVATAQDAPTEAPEKAPVAAAPAAQPAVDAEVVAPIGDAFDEIVVYGDLFARWDNTRWYVTTELGVPLGLAFSADENTTFYSNNLQIFAILACDKDWKLGRKKYEVSCVLEDFAMKASIEYTKGKPKRVDKAQAILDQIDQKLTGASLQLQVVEDGRVTNIQLEGLSSRNSRERGIEETLRQVLSRMAVGFDLRLRRGNNLTEGTWLEYNSSLMGMPSPYGTSSSGSSMVKHYLNRFDGHVIVQTIGQGMVSLNFPGEDGLRHWKTDLVGVSIFDYDEGYMTERVWALDGKSTAGSFFNAGDYWHAGRINLLGESDHPDLGATQVVNGVGKSDPTLPKWESIER